MGNLSPLARRLLSSYIGVILVIMYVPIVTVGLASISKSRFFIFPIRKTSTKWYEQTWSSLQIQDSFITSLSVAACVALISVILAFFGALAYARYDWRGRSLFQQILLIPIFFPQAVLGLALQLWFNSLGINMSWEATVFAQMVWIVPIVTLIIAIQAFGYDAAVEEAAFDLGASRWMIFRTITLPLLGPGVFAGFLFAILLSWGNFPLAYFTSGADVTT
ncbi:MAG: ABC transporter permease, partial [Rhodospirillaceae bacterium]|nr:ABC transporter permease [Rhodospirillaceae bacterium]